MTKGFVGFTQGTAIIYSSVSGFKAVHSQMKFQLVTDGGGEGDGEGMGMISFFLPEIQ